jgi:hypothetical protein
LESCSSQLRHLHKEYLTVEGEKVGTSSKLAPYKEPNVDLKDEGTSAVGNDQASIEKRKDLENEGRSMIDFFEGSIENATRKFSQKKCKKPDLISFICPRKSLRRR